MARDPRLQAATSRYASAKRRKSSTPADVAIARRDLAAIQILVAVDRALSGPEEILPLTVAQKARIDLRLMTGWTGGEG